MGKRGNGEGSIYYSEKLKRWIGQYTYNGKRKSVYGKTRTEVKNKLNQNLVDIENKKYIEKSNYTLSDIIDMIIRQQYISNMISDSTYRRKLETFEIIKKNEIANIKIQDIVPKKINDYLLTLLDYSNSVITKVSQMIRSAFDKAIVLGIINNNPYNIKGYIIIPKSNKRTKIIDALTIDEQKLFINELNDSKDEYKNIFFIAVYTGMRIGEILALSPDDIDLKNNIININKTLTKDINDKYIIGSSTKTYSGTRQIPITNLIYTTLVNHSKCQFKTIFNHNGKIIAPNTINSHFKRICKKAGIEKNVNTHMLRHTYATRCIEAGMNATVLSKLLGHADIDTTLNTYTSVFNKFKDDEVCKYTNYISQLH